MKKLVLKPSFPPFSSLFFTRFVVSITGAKEGAEKAKISREGPEISYGLNCALAAKGIIVNDKAFQNLKTSELQQQGATIAESLSGIPVHVRGNVLGEASGISKAQFSKLLRQVTTHISSISSIFILDGAIGMSSKCDAKVRVISDDPSAVLLLSDVLWRAPTRAISHDSRPLTVYAATSISPRAGEVIGLGAQVNNGFIAADIDRSSLVLCGKAFSDAIGTKEALATLAGPIIFSRGGLLLSARLLVLGNSIILLFASEDVVQSFSDALASMDSGVILSTEGVAPLFQTGNCDGPMLFKLPDAVIFATCDSSGSIPSLSKISPGQAAYHFLAGYQNGKFVPAYTKAPSSLHPLELATSLFSKLNDDHIPSFIINVGEGERCVTGKDLLILVESTLSKVIPPFEPKGGELRRKYKAYLSLKFQELPQEFSF